MNKTFDQIVIGLGGMGSAALYQIARRGKRAIGLERYTSPHNQGASHGKSRIIRQAYFEDPAYVPLLMRAYELWGQIERETGKNLLTITGGLMIGDPDSQVVRGSIRSASEHNIPHEILDSSEMRKRYSPLNPPDGFIALYEKMAGFLHPEETVSAHLKRASELGAEIHFEEVVLNWNATENGVEVRTNRDTYRAERLIITPGPWAPELLTELKLPLKIERLIMYWFEPSSGIEPFLPDRFPIHIWAADDGVFYGFPAQEGSTGGVKVGLHSSRTACTPDTIDRTVHQEEITLMQGYLAKYIPSLNSKCLNAITCMYTTTPDENFIIGVHPLHSQVTIAAGFSGHGYKFSSVVGEILADLAIDGKTHHPIELFSPLRWRE